MLLDTEAERKLEQFRAHLLDVNRRINLVSRKNSSQVVDGLIADSLAILALFDYPIATRLLDIGSGAGFPWIVHKIARPDLRIVSVDASQRKIEFQRESARLLGLADCEFHAARIESLPQLGVDFCIAKAFGRVELICELAGKHLNPAGRLLLPRSATEPVDIEAIGALGFGFERETAYEAVGKQAKLLVLRRQ